MNSRFLRLAFQFGKEDFWAGLNQPRRGLGQWMTRTEYRAWCLGYDDAARSALGHS